MVIEAEKTYKSCSFVSEEHKLLTQKGYRRFHQSVFHGRNQNVESDVRGIRSHGEGDENVDKKQELEGMVETSNTHTHH